MTRITDLEHELRESRALVVRLGEAVDSLTEDNAELQSGYDFLDDLTDDLEEEIRAQNDLGGVVVHGALPGFRLRVSLADGALDVEFAPDPVPEVIQEFGKPDFDALFADARLDTADEEDD